MEKTPHMKDRTNSIVKKVLEQQRRSLLEPEAKRLCTQWGIPVPKFRVAQTAKEAAELAERIGLPAVLKIVSKDIVHKTDVGGVLTNLRTKTDVKRGYDMILRNTKCRIPNACIEGVLVQRMVPSSLEVIVGGLRDDQFGPAVMFGMGGIFTEIFKDVVFTLAPITVPEALQMIDRIRASCLFNGYRGQPRLDRNVLADIIIDVSRMMEEIPEISEIDLNPVIVYKNRASAIDARIMLSSPKD
jgi:acetyl-CoA synthetase (ADP-forming)